MNKLSNEQRARVIRCLVEGNSLRSTVRITGVAMNTVLKLLVDLGEACSLYQDRTLRNLPCQRVQCDEIWCFCHNKQKNVAPEHAGELGYGDVWTWVTIDAETKLVPSWLVGKRDGNEAAVFIYDLSQRLASLEQARAFCRTFFAWYNHQHRHSGIGYHTPADVHHRQAEYVNQRRAEVLQAAYTVHPERFVRQVPVPPTLPGPAFINPPLEEVLPTPSFFARPVSKCLTTSARPGALHAQGASPAPRRDLGRWASRPRARTGHDPTHPHDAPHWVTARHAAGLHRAQRGQPRSTGEA